MLLANETEMVMVGEVQSYNMKTKYDLTPVFINNSVRIMELLLQFDDLKVWNENGCPLLWRCAWLGIVSQEVAKDSKLREQYGTKYWSTLPVEAGDWKYCT